MHVKVISTYENVDEKWLEWWLKRLNNEEVMPGCTNVIKKLRETDNAHFTTKDPTSSVIATTTYQIFRN